MIETAIAYALTFGIVAVGGVIFIAYAVQLIALGVRLFRFGMWLTTRGRR